MVWLALPHIEVLARASAFYVSRQLLTSSQIGKSLGIRYLVSGNSQLISNRIRITLSIIDTENDIEK